MARLNQTPDPAIQAELDRISQLPGAPKSRIPGVPDRALLRSLAIALSNISAKSSVVADIDWIDEYSNKLTCLTLDHGYHVLKAGNNTEFVAELLRFYVEAHMHRPVEPKAIGPVVCLID